MSVQESKNYLDLKAIVTILILTLIWGFNFPTIKYVNQGIAPVFASTIRSVIASICGVIYCIEKKETLFHRDIRLFHGFMVGLMFGVEFACIYSGMLYTDAARSILFVNLSPFVVAVGAHFFLKGDRLTLLKMVGLTLAFTGIVTVFGERPKTAKTTMIFGDVLEITAAFLWGATTLYIKKFMAEKVEPIHTFLYQLIFSIPVMLIVSFVLEPQWIYKTDASILALLFYQSVIVAFMSYFIWFKLIHEYSVSRLSAFTFLTPIYGVLLGILFLKEEFTFSLMVGLPMVSLGIFFVNWRRRKVL
jgi:drug/metabolite transporter (DMT)-like permease